MRQFRPPLLAVAVVLALTGCPEEEQSPADAADKDTAQDSGAASDAGSDAGHDAGPPDSGPVDTGPPTATAKSISELQFAVPKVWSSPLDAYLEAGYKKTKTWDFRRGIHDLAVYKDRLYMGYGDATANVGSVFPITARYFDDPAINQPKDEFSTAEEEIHRFRHIGDELWIAGVDATEDGWLGNVYYRTPDASWVKKRTVQAGVHVHDVALWNGAHYAVGSGAEQAQWQGGSVWGHLWKSTDKGDTWEVVSKHWNAEDGDARWTSMLSLKSKLYVFGYAIKASAPKDPPSLPNGTYTGTGLPPTVENLPGNHPLKAAFIDSCWPTGEDSGVVSGINFLQATPGYAAWRIVGDDVTMMKQFEAHTVLDVFAHGTGEALVLTRTGVAPNGQTATEVWQLQVWRTEDFVTFDKLLDFPSGEMVESIAYWRGDIYMGATGGQMWRAKASWK